MSRSGSAGGHPAIRAHGEWRWRPDQAGSRIHLRPALASQAREPLLQGQARNRDRRPRYRTRLSWSSGRRCLTGKGVLAPRASNEHTLGPQAPKRPGSPHPAARDGPKTPRIGLETVDPLPHRQGSDVAGQARHCPGSLLACEARRGSHGVTKVTAVSPGQAVLAWEVSGEHETRPEGLPRGQTDDPVTFRVRIKQAWPSEGCPGPLLTSGVRSPRPRQGRGDWS
jgi:hypothetical protein